MYSGGNDSFIMMICSQFSCGMFSFLLWIYISVINVSFETSDELSPWFQNGVFSYKVSFL